MHELPVTEEILKIALNHGEKNGAHKIVRIYLSIGELTDLIDEWVQRYFDYLAKDSMAQDAKLIIERIPIRVLCDECGETFEVDKKIMDFACPACGERSAKLLSGREFTVKSIEIM
ncbi:MAG: hydrogenase maturation nickel metallochaperone HypA [Deltaproteobacteria bacterium]|nr:hydrogenase maturation nickel metallochaperone HypA [Candidatus Zymogenaceae bacterium]